MTMPKSVSDEEQTISSLKILFSELKNAFPSIAFGTILFTIHEGKVVAMDVTNKHRLKP